MKILYLITKGERGGAQSHVWTLMQSQHFGTPLLAMGEDGYLGDQAREEGIPTHIIPHLVRPIHPWSDLRAVYEVVRLIRSEQPGLIHAHTAKAGMIARLAGFLTGTPTAYTVHAWSFVSTRSRVARTVSVWLERALSLMNQTVIEVSQSNFTMAERTAVAPRSNHLIIRNGVPDTTHRAIFSDDGQPVEIIMVARFTPPKDHCLLLEALAPLPGNWRCTFVGGGPDEAKAVERAAALGIPEKVRFLGDRDNVAWLLSQAHLFVLCSDSESLPISILEAMRAGLPVLSSDVGGCSELVADGITGVLTAPGDLKQLRGHLTRLLASKALLKSLGQRGRARFETNFRVESMVRQTVAAYSRMIPISGIPGVAANNI